MTSEPDTTEAVPDSQSDSQPDSQPGAQSDPDPDPSDGVACDFCGEVVDTVRRVALDGDYDRLRTRHRVQYSCATCFDKKERERTAAAAR